LDSIESSLHKGTWNTEDDDPIAAAYGSTFGAPQSIPLNLHGISRMAPIEPPAPATAIAAVAPAPVHVMVPRSNRFIDRLSAGEPTAMIVTGLGVFALLGFGWWAFGSKVVFGKAIGAALLAG